MINPRIQAGILAAGESRRLGRPKQLLTYAGKSLLQHCVEQVVNTPFCDAHVVLGAYASKIGAETIDVLPNPVYNPNWGMGMGKSIAYLVAKILEHDPQTTAILLTTCDLPLVDTNDYRNMLAMFESEADIVASVANRVYCPPVLFGRHYFAALMELSGAKGAKSILQRHPDKLKAYANSRAAIDIDNEELALRYCQ